MKQQKQQRITVIIGDGFYAGMIAVCKERGMTPSELIRNAIIAYVQTQWNITLTDDTRKQGYQR